MYSKHRDQNTASPNACGFSRLNYDAMNPTEKNGSKHPHKDTRATNTPNKQIPGDARQKKDLSHHRSSVERKMPTQQF